MWQMLARVIEALLTTLIKQIDTNFIFLVEIVVLMFIYVDGAWILQRHGDSMLLTAWLTGGAVVGALLRAFQGSGKS
jgi:hypothetical protein